MFRGLFRGLLEAARENERDRAPLFYTPGSMSERAAGKLKKKKKERPKNVLGALFFPLFQMHLLHAAPFSSFNQLPPSYPRTLRLSASISSFLSPLYHRLLSESLSESPEGCRPLCLHLPLPSCILLFLSQSCHISREKSGSSGFPSSLL